MSILQVENLCAGYGKKTIINDISITIEKGELVGLLGPNGCGKSTLMKALCKGIESEGCVLLDQINVNDLSEKELAKMCSYVPQSSGLAIDITAKDAVLMGFYPYLGIFESPGEVMHKKAEEILTELGLGEQVSANYMELSEGQKRLCILARSLVTDAKLLLMDEPDAALDFGVRNKILQMVIDEIKKRQSGVLCNLHDANLALAYCNRIYLMKDGQITNTICPDKDSVEYMEECLSDLYGSVKLLPYQIESETKYAMVQA